MRPECGNNLVRLRPAAAQDAGEHVPPTRSDNLAVRKHVELTALTDLEHSFNVQLFLNGCRETRGSLFIASSGAIPDLDFHSVSWVRGIFSGHC